LFVVPRPPCPPLFPYTTLFRSNILGCLDSPTSGRYLFNGVDAGTLTSKQRALLRRNYLGFVFQGFNLLSRTTALENVELPLIYRSEEHTSELQSRENLVCRLLL